MRRALVILALVLAAGTASAQPGDEKPRPMREKEVLRERTSGFWTSNRKADEPYRWRLLLIGCGLLGGTGFVMWRLVRRASRARQAGSVRRAGSRSA